MDSARAKYWLGVGAQPSDPAWRLLAMVSLLYFLLVLVFLCCGLGAMGCSVRGHLDSRCDASGGYVEGMNCGIEMVWMI